MWINWKLFQKNSCNLHFDPFSPNFDLFGSLKWPKNRAIFFTPLKVTPVETPVETLDKKIKNPNFDLFGSAKWPKKFGLWYLSFTHLQFDRIHRNIFLKIVENLHFDPFWPNSGSKGPEYIYIYIYIYSTHTWITHNVPVKQVLWSHIKNFLRKWLKASKNPYFGIFFVIKKQPKQKNQNSNSTGFGHKKVWHPYWQPHRHQVNLQYKLRQRS